MQSENERRRVTGGHLPSGLLLLRMQHLHEECLRWGTAVDVLVVEEVLTTQSQRPNLRHEAH